MTSSDKLLPERRSGNAVVNNRGFEVGRLRRALKNGDRLVRVPVRLSDETDEGIRKRWREFSEVDGLQSVPTLLKRQVLGRQERTKNRCVVLGPDLIVQDAVVDRHEPAFSRPVRASGAERLFATTIDGSSLAIAGHQSPCVARQVHLPRGLEREHVHEHNHDYGLRGSENVGHIRCTNGARWLTACGEHGPPVGAARQATREVPRIVLFLSDRVELQPFAGGSSVQTAGAYLRMCRTAAAAYADTSQPIVIFGVLVSIAPDDVIDENETLAALCLFERFPE